MRHLIKLALVLNAGVAAAFVWLFSSPFGWFIGGIAAGSLVSTYIGLAFADIPAEQRPRALWVALAACSVESLYGFLYVLSLQSPDWFTPPLPWYGSVPLAALHGAAFSILAFFISLFVVHAHQPAPASAPADPQSQAIADALGAVVDVSRAILDRMDQPRAIAAPEPRHDVPLLAQDTDQTIDVNGKALSLRQLADVTGVPLTTLRRRIEKV